jgi:hypothetical protein
MDHAAGLLWRLRRIPRLEAANLGSNMRDTLIYMLQMADTDTRKKVLQRLAELQQARHQEGPVSNETCEIGFSADLAQALCREMPEAFSAVMESMKKAPDSEGELAKLARYEARLRSDLYRTLSWFYSLRAARSMQG